MKDVVEIVVPLRVERGGMEAIGVVAFVFEDEVDVAARGLLAQFGGHRVEEVVILDRMDRIKPKSVEAVFGQPHQRVVDEIAVDRRLVDGDGAAPGGVDVGVEEALRIGAEVISVGAEVIVDDVEEYREAEFMGAVDQRLQLVGRAVALSGGVGQHAVIAPVARAAERVDGHEFDRGHAERCDCREMIRDACEAAERADMDFLDDHLLPRTADPVCRAPVIGGVIDDDAPPMDAARLYSRGRIGDGEVVAQAEPVPRPWPYGRRGAEPAVGAARHGNRIAIRDLQRHDVAIGSPEAERRPVFGERGSPIHAAAIVQDSNAAPCGGSS